MKPYTYLIIDLGCIVIPLLASFYSKHAFYKEWKWFFPANFLVTSIFLIWDFYFTEIGVWGFNSDYLTGIYIKNLPLEEILFFICIPYACCFTFFALQYLVKSNPLAKFHRLVSIGLAAMALVIGITHLDHWYTVTTFTGLSGYLALCLYLKINQSYSFLSFVLILPFFFISNGILTGSGVESPIVWYNDEENLSIRMFTIPIEDTFYGLLLILMNLNIYQWLKNKRSPASA